MEILKTHLEEQLLVNNYMVKHLILLLKISNVTNIRGLASMFYKYFYKKIKGLQVVLLKVKLCQTKN